MEMFMDIDRVIQILSEALDDKDWEVIKELLEDLIYGEDNPIEEYNNGIIIYGLGDLINDYAVKNSYKSDYAMICIIYKKLSIQSLRADLGKLPTFVSINFPSLNNIRVGIPLTLYF